MRGSGDALRAEAGALCPAVLVAVLWLSQPAERAEHHAALARAVVLDQEQALPAAELEPALAKRRADGRCAEHRVLEVRVAVRCLEVLGADVLEADGEV